MKIPNDYMFVAEVDDKDVYFDAYKDGDDIDVTVLHVVVFDENNQPSEYDGDYYYFVDDCIEYLENSYWDTL